ncbi:MAG: hypothetical protein GEV04_16375 [Actinophytocola sp.]|nr:hypothetical protein [Actinophytocola sp.]
MGRQGDPVGPWLRCVLNVQNCREPDSPGARLVGVRCEQCREQVSARLDTEDDPGLSAAVDAHLASCESCRRWQEAAARVTRLARMSVASATPDLSDAVLARARRPRRHAVKLVLRVVLALLAVGQIALGVAHIDGVPGFTGHAPGVGTAPAHFTHEFAAFTIAVGIGFAWIAWRTRRVSGLVPTLATFVVLLTTLELVDLARGAVDPSRLASHTLVQAGLVVVLLLSTRRLGGDGFSPWQRQAPVDDGHAPPGALDAPDESGRGGEDGLRPRPRHDAA